MKDSGSEENREVSEKSFVRERIVDRQSGRRWMRKILAVCVCGILFGLTAGITLAGVFPMAQGWFDRETESETQSPVVIPPDTPSQTETSGESSEESTQEATEAEDPSGELNFSEEELQEYILDLLESEKKNWLSNPEFMEELYNMLAKVGKTYRKALVTVEWKGTMPGWFDDPIVTEGGECAGMIWNRVEDGSLYVIAGGAMPKDGTAIQVKFYNGRILKAQLCQRDSVTGLTMLKIEGSLVDDDLVEAIHVMPLGNSYMVEQGDLLLVIGNTSGYVGSIVPAVATYTEERIYEVDGAYRRIELNIATEEGANGFVLSPNGEIMGIITPDMAGTYTGMLAVSDLKGVMQLLANGRPVPYLGIYGQTVTSVISETNGLPQGVYVTEVEGGSPAYMAGIKPGDVVIGIGNSTVLTINSMRTQVENIDPNAEVVVKVMRAGTEGYQELVFTFMPGTR